MQKIIIANIEKERLWLEKVAETLGIKEYCELVPLAIHILYEKYGMLRLDSYKDAFSQYLSES